MGFPRVTIDHRSDTVTQPTDEMRQAMCTAVVGDLQYNDDPTVTLLEETAATMFGKEAALFVPSGIMANLLAIAAHCENRGCEVILGSKSHIGNLEQGGIVSYAGVFPRLVPNQNDGQLTSQIFLEPSNHPTSSMERRGFYASKTRTTCVAGGFFLWNI